ADPTGDGHLAGRRGGHVVGARAPVLGGHPAPVDHHGRAVGGDQWHHHVDPGLAVPRAVAHDHGVVDVVGAGGGDRAPLVGATRTAVEPQQLLDRDGVGSDVALDDRVAFV